MGLELLPPLLLLLPHPATTSTPRTHMIVPGTPRAIGLRINTFSPLVYWICSSWTFDFRADVALVCTPGVSNCRSVIAPLEAPPPTSDYDLRRWRPVIPIGGFVVSSHKSRRLSTTLDVRRPLCRAGRIGRPWVGTGPFRRSVGARGPAWSTLAGLSTSDSLRSVDVPSQYQLWHGPSRLGQHLPSISLLDRRH